VCWGASTCDPRNLRVSRLSTVTPVVVGRYRAHLMQVNRKGSVVIGPLLLIVIVVGVAIFWMRQTRMSGSRSHEPTTSEILDRRYASGEVSKEQYEQMKRDLA
jgi:putative membrane protein